MGSPEFAVPALEALHTAGHAIVCVYSQPPRPAGRGQSIRLAPVHAAADRLGLPVRTPSRVRRDADEHAFFASLQLDAAVVAAYGLILPEAMLAAPARGCLNIHASLLPRWRGAAPIQAAIMAGDTETGITIMQMDAGLDTGPMLLRESIPITERTTAPELQASLAALGASLIVRTLANDPSAVPQPADGVTYAPKLTRDDGRLDFTQSSAILSRRVRALNPWPGTFAQLGGVPLKILAVGAEPRPHSAPSTAAPGTTLDDALLLATGDGALRVLRLQAPGRAAMDAAAFLRGHKVSAGTSLDVPAA